MGITGPSPNIPNITTVTNNSSRQQSGGCACQLL